MSTNSKSKKRSTNSKPVEIEAISICGYKSIHQEQCIEIRPLTFLAGANSSGKSSIIQPLLLLKQTLEAPYDPGALLLEGPNVRLTSANQFLSNIIGKKCHNHFYMRFHLSDDRDIKMSYGVEPGDGISILSMQHNHDGKQEIFTPGMSHAQIEKNIPEALKNLRTDLERLEKRKLRWVVGRDRCFLYFTLELKEDPDKRPFQLSNKFTPTAFIESAILRLIHLPSLRGNPERTYKTTAVGEHYPGTFENYVASIITHWKTTDDNKLKKLGTALERLGLTWKVEPVRVDDTRVELRAGRLPHAKRGGAYDLVNIADVGFGVSQVLPVIVALLVAGKGQFVYLQQPEIHLHPRAQTALAKVLAEAANRGVRVVVETHSQLLLTAIQTLVAEGNLSSDKVKLHWFSRNDEGATEVSSADLDESGAFGDWPEDFAEVSLQTESAYLDAAMSKSLSS